MKSEARRRQGTCVWFGTAKGAQPAARKECITRARTDIQAAKEAERGIGSLKVGDVATASLFGVWDEPSRFRRDLAREFSNDIVA